MDFSSFWACKKATHEHTINLLQLLHDYPEAALDKTDLNVLFDDASAHVGELGVHLTELPLLDSERLLDFDKSFLEPQAKDFFDEFFHSEDSLERLSRWTYVSLPTVGLDENDEPYVPEDYKPCTSGFDQARVTCLNVIGQLELYERGVPELPWQKN